MISGVKRVVLADIESIDNERFEKTNKVANGKILALKVDLAGVNVMQLGQSQGYVVSLSIEIPRIQYNNEKYCFLDSQLYEIESISKAKLATNMLLNVSKLNDSEISEAILNWLKEKNGL